MSRVISYNSAILEALDQMMTLDKKIVIIGEGVPDPEGIFGTTINLQKKFGPNRVFDSPLSENAITGICAGLSIYGFRPVLIHQRIDFSLLSMDQIVNNIAKWHFMFNKQQNIPIILRLIIGRGWGQGPQHSQSLHNIYASIPGLQVAMPTSPSDAKGMLISALKQNNPTIFIEHRWLQNIKEIVPKKIYSTPLTKAKLIKRGKDFTIVCFSYMTIEALRATKALKHLDIHCDLIDMRSVSPLDISRVLHSVTKTRKLLIADVGHSLMSIANELAFEINKKLFKILKSPIQKISLPNYPAATSHHLTKDYYPGSKEIFDIILQSEKIDFKKLNKNMKNTIMDILKPHKKPHDVPDTDFFGPF